MKQFTIILTLIFTMMACSSDDKEEDKDVAKTTFSVRSESTYLYNASVFYKENGELKKLADIGNITSLKERETVVDNNDIKELYIQYLFQDKPWQVDTTFVLKHGEYNLFTIKKGTKHTQLD